MPDLQQLQSDLQRAASFDEAVELFMHWARELSGSEATTVRVFGQDGNGQQLPESQPAALQLLPICGHQGATAAYLRDESVVAHGECMCGRVAAGQTDADLPFFTFDGSFAWGKVQTLSQVFSPQELGALRGRCIAEGYDSLAVIPLWDGEQRVGILHLADRRPDRFDDNLALLEHAGRLVGAELARFGDENHALRSLEAALMPLDPPRVSGLDVGVDYAMASAMSEFGGDFYDLVERPSGETMVFLGDSIGKGMDAAGNAARSRLALNALARTAASAGEFIDRGDRLIDELLPEGKFVTLAAALFPAAGGPVRVALAGHPRPLVFRHGGRIEEVPAPYGPPLGALPSRRQQVEVEVTLEPQDSLLLFSDGIMDARRDGVLFGVEGISAALANLKGRHDHPGGLRMLARRVRKASDAHHDPALSPDDRLILAVRQRTVPPRP